MIVAVKALVQLVFYALATAVAFALMSHLVYGDGPVRAALSGGAEIAGEVVDANDPGWLWFRSRGEVTTILCPIPREQVTLVVPIVPEQPRFVSIDDVLRHYRVPTVAELVRKAFLGELKPSDLGT